MRHLTLLLFAALACTPSPPPAPAPAPVRAPQPEPAPARPPASGGLRPERAGSVFGGVREFEHHYGTGHGAVGGVVGALPAAPAPSERDAPALPLAGWRKPATGDKECLGRNIRVPADLLDHVTGLITVKFAILADGKPARFEVLSTTSDPRVVDAIWQAVQACTWIPGADAQGRPANVWVILPIRLQ